MSLDVEGAEVDILKSLDLGQDKIAVMTIEQNNEAGKKAKIREYLDRFGHEVLEWRNDDFFFRRPMLQAIMNATFLDPVEAQEKVAKTYKIYDR